MAGIEQLEIHSKSYLIRWVNVPGGHSISWSIQPYKKSINFGIFKHPGTQNGLTPSVPSGTNFEPLSSSNEGAATRPRRVSTSAGKSESSNVVERLQGIGLRPVAWTGKCEADKVSMGKYDVLEGEGGMYGLVFDNTFSKTLSKTATFVLRTHPSNAPLNTGNSLHFAQAFGVPGSSQTSLVPKPSPALQPINDSEESLSHGASGKTTESRPRSGHGSDSLSSMASPFYTGNLHKKRRKRNQGYATRFFSLDFTSSTLSYYRNHKSSALRGSIPLSLAAISANEKTREISVDSGAEVWHLKAGNQKDFEGWQEALERAARSAVIVASPVRPSDLKTTSATLRSSAEDESEWARAEALVGRVAGIRDAVRRLAKDTDPKYLPSAGLGFGCPSRNGSPNTSESALNDPQDDEKTPVKLPFWKRKASSGNAGQVGAFRRSVSAQMATAASSSILPVPPLPNGSLTVRKKPSQVNLPPQAYQEEGMHDHCMALLRDLDAVVTDFSVLLSEAKQRRSPAPPANASRISLDSASSEEFFDAEDGNMNRSNLLLLRRDSDSFEPEVPDNMSDSGGSETSADDDGIAQFETKKSESQSTLFPSKAKSLAPLPLERVSRRSNVPAPKVAPPSLIGFLRKNVGKDLSTISMPVSANEPTSLLQRCAEQLEYSELLDKAANASQDVERLLYVAAFAISGFSNSRVKERAIRKPFNPMLGETFELVREDMGFRFIAEKVTHRPVRMAFQADAKDWAFAQSPMPVQKFWGKSAELNTDGRARVKLYSTGDHFSWVQATAYLRNIIAGEKYVEPVQSMTVVNETNGHKAIATFKAGGMFSGRSEEVVVSVLDGQGNTLPLGLAGKWTSHLSITTNGVTDDSRKIWMVGALVPNASTHYGFTAFAASLNEITKIEQGHLPVTDSRLRPDQRAVEEGDLDRAEALKAKLEERQRARRRVMEEHGHEWTPKWFVKVAGGTDSSTHAEGTSDGPAQEEVWTLKTGKDGYWDERARGTWDGVREVFES